MNLLENLNKKFIIPYLPHVTIFIVNLIYLLKGEEQSLLYDLVYIIFINTTLPIIFEYVQEEIKKKNKIIKEKFQIILFANSNYIALKITPFIHKIIVSTSKNEKNTIESFLNQQYNSLGQTDYKMNSFFIDLYNYILQFFVGKFIILFIFTLVIFFSLYYYANHLINKHSITKKENTDTNNKKSSLNT